MAEATRAPAGGLRHLRGYRRLWLAWKALRQRIRGAGGVHGQPLFVVGSQRSGTSAFVLALDHSAHTWVYLEQAPEIQDHWRVRPHEALREAIQRPRARRVVLKPLWDSHRIDHLLAAFPGGRAVWLFRGYADVARSSVKLFGGWQRDLLGAVAQGDPTAAGWAGERLDAETRSLIAREVRLGLSEIAGAALFWYTRNLFVFSLGLEVDERVLLVRYEDMLARPEHVLRRVCAHAQIPYESRLIRDLEPRSPAAGRPLELPEGVRAACEDLERRLIEVHRAAWD